jgi:RimJ/RimL family protein N-acetyltransferase
MYGIKDAEVDALVHRIRKRPFSIVLLDEFETAHPRVARKAITTKSMPVAEQPLGPSVPTGSALRPSAVVLEGQFGRVEKLNPARHRDDLWRATAGHDRIWTYMAYGPFADAKTFSCWLVERAALADPFAYVVINQTGRAVGITTLREIRPEMRVIEVGHIVYSPELQGTPLGTEAQYLLARYVFEELGYRRYEWRCNTLNAASRRAAPRLGFTFEGIFRQDMIVKGRSRDTAWYAMLDHQWPLRKLAFERWLAPDNFDADGRQRASLSDLRVSDRFGHEDAAGFCW